MKNYQKLAVAVMGLLLTASMGTVISAHAEEPVPTEPMPTQTAICIEPWWHMYELTDVNLQEGDTLHLEFAGDGVYYMDIDITNEESNQLDGGSFYEYSDKDNKVKINYTVSEPVDSVKIYTMIFSDNDAELVSYNVSSEPQVVDVVLTHKYLHGKQTITQEEFTKLDRNYDNTVNIYDFVILKQQLIKSGIAEPPQEISKKINAVTDNNDVASVTVAGWDSAMSDTNYTFESFEHFDEIITQLFKPAVVRSLERTYDEEFFKQNLLCMNLWAQNPDDDFTMHIGDVIYKNNKLYIDYHKSYLNEGIGEKRVIISQVAVPKAECSGYDSVVWGMENTQPVNYEYAFDSAKRYYGDGAEEPIEPKLICSYEELLEYADTLGYSQKETALEKYSAEFFETKAVYFRPVYYVESGAEETAWNVRKQGNTITADIKVSRPPTDNLTGTIGLGQLILDKADAENAVVSCRECTAVMHYYGSNETFDGEMIKYYIPDMHVSLAVNQYRFKDGNAIEFYWYYSGSGGSGYEFIDSEDVDLIYQPFVDNIEIIEDDIKKWENNYEGENYSIIYNPDKNSLTVKFKTSAGSDEFVTKEFEAPVDAWWY
ncbi:MAG: hypothetical protein K2G88_03050 [Oscillospiraceae bacterium]|nr:hypothetical protein [Oscillospiraceae bacterium]